MEKYFTMKWKKNGSWHHKEVDREKFMDIMKSIKNGFDGNNEISAKLCSFDNIEVIEINFDRNMDNPEQPKIIVCTPETQEAITIINFHKIIWAILNGYCVTE